MEDQLDPGRGLREPDKAGGFPGVAFIDYQTLNIFDQKLRDKTGEIMKTFIPGSILLVFIVIFATGCLTAHEAPSGILEGKVTIGPICPVERIDQPCTPAPGAYEARKIFIFRNDGKTLVKTVTIDANGHYRAELKEDTYIVEINHIGIDRSPDVPAFITVMSGQTVAFNITIDTGIR